MMRPARVAPPTRSASTSTRAIEHLPALAHAAGAVAFLRPAERGARAGWAWKGNADPARRGRQTRAGEGSDGQGIGQAKDRMGEGSDG